MALDLIASHAKHVSKLVMRNTNETLSAQIHLFMAGGFGAYVNNRIEDFGDIDVFIMIRVKCSFFEVYDALRSFDKQKESLESFESSFKVIIEIQVLYYFFNRSERDTIKPRL